MNRIRLEKLAIKLTLTSFSTEISSSLIISTSGNTIALPYINITGAWNSKPRNWIAKYILNQPTTIIWFAAHALGVQNIKKLEVELIEWSLIKVSKSYVKNFLGSQAWLICHKTKYYILPGYLDLESI